jgi:DNA-binding Lrp family transcriptional regulator
MLTNTDLKLISALEKDGRASYAQLSQKLGISISSVARNIKSLIEDNVFTIHAVPNPFRLGYKAIAIIAMNVNMNNIYDVCDQLKDNFYANSIYITYGRFNVILTAQFPTWDQLHEFVSSEIFSMSYIYETEIFFIRDIKKRTYDWIDAYSENKPLNIDEIDQKIMEELAINGRYSRLHLANSLGINVSSISRRLSYLLKERAIAIRAIPNPAKLGYKVIAFIFIRADYAKIEDICTKLGAHREVENILTLFNPHQIYLRVVTHDQETLNDLVIKKISQIPGITSMETLISGEVVKRYYGFLVDDMSIPRVE